MFIYLIYYLPILQVLFEFGAKRLKGSAEENWKITCDIVLVNKDNRNYCLMMRRVYFSAHIPKYIVHF